MMQEGIIPGVREGSWGLDWIVYVSGYVHYNIYLQYTKINIVCRGVD